VLRWKKLCGVALAFCLLSAPAWASRTDDEAVHAKKKATSIRLTAPKPAERPFPSQSLVDMTLAALARIDDKSSGSHGSKGGPPPGLQKRSLVRRGHDGEGRGPASGLAPGADVAAVPEPSALLSFGIGLLVARRAIGAMWR
jgi:hypothetical protein